MLSIHVCLRLEHYMSTEHAKQPGPVLECGCLRSGEHELTVLEVGNSLQALHVGPMAHLSLGVGTDNPGLLKQTAPMSHLSFVPEHFDGWHEGQLRQEEPSVIEDSRLLFEHRQKSRSGELLLKQPRALHETHTHLLQLVREVQLVSLRRVQELCPSNP